MIREFYVYEWLRTDGTPYYVGKGKGFRAYVKRQYKPIDKKRINIIKNNLTEQEAFDLETKLIAKYGRKDIGTGILRNKTDGGEGYALSEQTKRKLSIANKGKTPWNKGLTAKTNKSVAKQAKARKGKSINFTYRSPISEEAKKRMSEGQKGKVYPTKPCEICGIHMKVNGMAQHIKSHRRNKWIVD